METTVILFVTGESRLGKLVRERLDRHKYLNPDLGGRIKVLSVEDHPHLAEHYGVTETPSVVAINDKHEKVFSFVGGNNFRNLKFWRRVLNYGKLGKTRKRIK